jgi:glycosyltransferase involved in cell wall biosynthesis
MEKGHMKKISILIPCYNEEANVILLYNEIIKIIANDLASYDYEIIFIDNCSTDNTRTLLRKICSENKKIKAIFNAKNFGTINSPYYGICQTSGDCTILLYADFQTPVDMIPQFIKEWESGYKIVAAVKSKSYENKIMRFLRTCYYKTIQKMSNINQIEHFDGFGLYDKSFVDVLKNLHDPIPFLRGIVAELGFARKDVFYIQQKRFTGKSHVNFFELYNAAMLSFTTYTKFGLRFATITGFITALISFIIGLVYLFFKLLFWDSFNTGIAPMIIGMFLLGSIQLFFIGFIGEYVMAINSRIMDRPLVIEEERINF